MRLQKRWTAIWGQFLWQNLDGKVTLKRTVVPWFETSLKTWGKRSL